MSATIGIQGVSDILMQTCEVSLEVSVSVVKKRDGTFHQSFGHSLVGNFSATTLGAAPNLRGTFSAPKISGVVIINEVSEEHKNDEFPSVKFSGRFYPSISASP